MSLNQADKEWIVSAIAEGIKPVMKELKDLKKIVMKNHPDDFK